MIKLQEHRVPLLNLGVTIEALEQLNYLIEYFSESKPGPVYVRFRHFADSEPAVQINRDIMVQALQDQRRVLIDYLATLGIDAEDG
jgi:hypothetical protein